MPAKSQDPALTMTKRFQALDEKIEAKCATTQAEVERAESAVEGFKKCLSDSKPRISVKALLESDEDSEDLEAFQSGQNGQRPHAQSAGGESSEF